MNTQGPQAVPSPPKQTVAEVLLQRARALVDHLAGQPKMGNTDYLWHQLKEACERVEGFADRHLGNYKPVKVGSKDGADIIESRPVLTNQAPTPLHAPWDAEPTRTEREPIGASEPLPLIPAHDQTATRPIAVVEGTNQQEVARPLVRGPQPKKETVQ